MGPKLKRPNSRDISVTICHKAGTSNDISGNEKVKKKNKTKSCDQTKKHKRPNYEKYHQINHFLARVG